MRVRYLIEDLILQDKKEESFIMTIKSIKIFNFQSHEKTFLKFHKRLNIICGKTDSGKSGLRRAIEWVVNNRPSGESFKSKWGGNTKVELLVKNKEGKSLISRKKGKENLYILNDNKYKAFGQDVPGDIRNVLQMSDINIQNQISLPFMLTMSAGETARYLNEIVSLEGIDKSLSNIQSILRKETSQLEERRLNKRQFIFDLQSYEWIDNVEEKLIKLEKEEKEIEALKEQGHQIQNIVGQIEIEQVKLNKLSKVDVIQLQKDLTKIEMLQKKIELDNKQIEEIENIVSDIEFQQEQLQYLKESNKQDIRKFKKLMPNICPLCGEKIR